MPTQLLNWALTPGAFDIADAVLSAGQPLTDEAMIKVSSIAKFGAVRCESIYMGLYKDGDDIGIPVSPVDGYDYSPEEVSYVCHRVTNRVYAVFTPGQAAPQSPESGNNSAEGHLYWWITDVNPYTHKVTCVTSYRVAGGDEHVTRDGIVKITAICQRLSVTANPALSFAGGVPSAGSGSGLSQVMRPTAFDNPDPVIGGMIFNQPSDLTSPAMAFDGDPNTSCAGYAGLYGNTTTSARWKGWASTAGQTFTSITLSVLSETANNGAVSPVAVCEFSIDAGATWTAIYSDPSHVGTSTQYVTDRVALPPNLDLANLMVRQWGTATVTDPTSVHFESLVMFEIYVTVTS